jgi:hypothetical protein
MSRTLSVDCKHRVRDAMGRWSASAASFVGRAFSAINDRCDPSRLLAAGLASVASAFGFPSAAFAAITISIQARGERRAPRFDH